MSRLLELREKLKDRPKADYDWGAEQLQAPPTLPHSDIKIRLGGIFSPGYEATYRAAWQALMHRARELAIPILYLQRHSLELTVKDTIRMLLDIRAEMRLGYDVFDIDASEKARDMADWNKDWNLVHRKHEFDPLFECLAKNLTLLELPAIPPDFHQAKDLIHLLDPGDGSLFRYDTVGKTRSRSFDRHPDGDPKVARLSDLARHLDAIANEHSRVSERGEGPVSFLDEIYQYSMGVNLNVEWAVRGMEKKTRDGEIVWSVEPTARVGSNTDLDSTLKLLPLCLAADVEGQRFVMVQLEGTNPYAYFLARERQGELSRALWLMEYHTNIYFAVKDSLEAKGVDVPW
jgi:hypothetical protein